MRIEGSVVGGANVAAVEDQHAGGIGGRRARKRGRSDGRGREGRPHLPQ